MFAKFKYWFVNVYWYHYRIHTAVTVFVLVLAGFFIHAVVTRVDPDFMFIVASEEPVIETQGLALADFFAENIDVETELQYSVMYLNGYDDYTAANWQLLSVALVDAQYSLFIIGESMLPTFAEQLDGFYTMEELGLPSGPYPELAPLDGVSLMAELSFSYEPMYALVKRPYPDRDSAAEDKNRIRSEKSVACLKALLGVK